MNSLLIYLALGVFFTMWMLIETWWSGDDFKVNDLWVVVVMFSCWPVPIFFVSIEWIGKKFNNLIDKINTEKVLIKGRKKNAIRR